MPRERYARHAFDIMSIELKVPDIGESIQEVQIRKWRKQEGDKVTEDEDLVELETDKASVDLPAPASGVVKEILIGEGETARIGDVLAILTEGEDDTAEDDTAEDDTAEDDTVEDEATAAESSQVSQSKSENGKSKKSNKKSKKKQDKRKKSRREDSPQTKDKPEHGKANGKSESESKEKPKEKQDTDAKQGEEQQQSSTELVDDQSSEERSGTASKTVQSTPAARREMRRHHISAAEITPRGDRIRPEDVRRHLQERSAEGKTDAEKTSAESGQQTEEVVPMSFLRQKISERLVAARQNAALLTTFNEIDMSAVVQLRKERGESFQERHEVKLGFMSFFVKATAEALKQQPVINAQVRDGDKIVYFKNFHIGIAIGSSRGLVVPVLRNADQMSFAEIEQAIDAYAQAAEEETLQPADLQGGTFTISNGGIYGSLLSTPIVNPPQSGVLGMHQIQDRAVVREKEIVIRPMMYVALSYDHRIIDGQEAVTFLRGIKESIEDPMRMLLDL